MSLSTFDANAYPPDDIFSGTFPKEVDEGQGVMQHRGSQSEPMDPSGSQASQQQGADHRSPQQHGGGQVPSQPSGEQAVAMEDSGGRASEGSLLGLSVIAVFVGQAVGIWLWRRRYARTAATQSA